MVFDSRAVRLRIPQESVRIRLDELITFAGLIMWVLQAYIDDSGFGVFFGAELRKLMTQFAPQSRSAERIELLAGLHGLKAVTPGAMEGLNGQRVDQVTFMVLWQTALRGELLIISAYDMAGDTVQAEEYVRQLLTGTTVNDAPILPEPVME